MEYKMTTEELSNAFTTLLNSYGGATVFGDSSPIQTIVLDEYEKSYFLTKAQEELVIAFYNGDIKGIGFEQTEELRRYLNTLVRTIELTEEVHNTESITYHRLDNRSQMYELPEDLMFITLEQVKYSDSEDLDCTVRGKFANVYPIKQDEFSRVKDNPFRGPTRYKALRLDSGESTNTVEIIPAYPIQSYTIRFLSKPTPIILEDDLPIGDGIKTTTFSVNDVVLNMVLDRAVRLALISKGVNINVQ